MEPDFDAFWILYPKRVAKKDARKAWSQITQAQQAAAITALADWRRVWMQLPTLDYVPHPATWLRGERWEDELPKGVRYEPPAPKEPLKLVEKAELPQHVKDQINRLLKRAS